MAREILAAVSVRYRPYASVLADTVLYILFALLFLLSVTRSPCFVQRGHPSMRQDVFARPAVVATKQGFSAVQEVLLDLPKGQVSHTRQVNPGSDFEKGNMELQK